MFEYAGAKFAEDEKNNSKASFAFKDILLIDIAEKWIHASKKSEHFCLFAVKRGSLRLWTSAGTVTLEEDSAVILPPLAKIRSASSDISGIRFFTADFDTSEPFFDTMSVYNIKDTQTVFPSLELLYQSKSGKADVFKAALLFSAVAQISECPHSALGKETELARDICRIIDQNIGKELDVDFIANTLSLDRSHISRVFSKTTGKTVKAYINEKRVAYACELLANSAFNVSKIAELIGFEDSNLFTKFFTYHTGTTPSDHRRGLHDIPSRSKKR
ncbi:MAG: helix-turn-helix transcriptional regulator [Clostridia bacterium]|nr:helix-turn-helix transcriptional regulator [Clostridia bacterium]